ncbi:hypothetical protein H5410_061866, partial [Solanum commersonii]
MSGTVCELPVRTLRSSVMSRAIFCFSLTIFASGVGASFGGAGMDSKLVASSDEAAWSFSPDPVKDLALDPVAWSDSDRE